MASTPKGRFTDVFKREAVALWETSGRPQAEIAAGLGIVPTLLRRWQRKQQESSAPAAGPAAKPPVSTMASPADQASEIARLRLQVGPGADGARHIEKSRRHLCGDAAVKFAFIEQHASTWPSERHVPHVRRVAQRLLRLSWPGTECANDGELGAARRHAPAPGAPSGVLRSPRMHAALRAESRPCSRGHVKRLMRRHRFYALAGRRFRPYTTDRRHYLPIVPNLLAQNFVATAPNLMWLADIR
ncbi:Transposase [Sphingomonas carotinifaciens]|uniref:Transposase n=1 Tax=Sphingomonas carotinifaciens TaxID=1166323 RepID=A0A1G7LZU7_9SPHN|nr:transposase-like protein [Sphingomonas carotinifaciens]SDF55027.1 Transposase [Sphingomonas carotinifaciens]